MVSIHLDSSGNILGEQALADQIVDGIYALREERFWREYQESQRD